MRKRKIYLLTISLMYGILFMLGNPALPEYTRSLGISDFFVGLYLASTGLGLLFFATFWGALGDIKDRNKVLALVFAGFGLGQLLFGIFRNEYLLLLAAQIGGIFFAGVLVNVYSYINDSFKSKEQRNKILSYAVSLYLLGGAVAYIFGGLLTDLFDPNVHYVFILQAILLFVFAAYIFFEKTDLEDIDHHLTRQHFYTSIRQAFKLPWLPIYTITLTFFVSFAHNNVKRFLDYYLRDSGYNATQLGLVVFTAGIVGLISNMYIAPFFLKRYHNFRFLQFQFILAPIFLYLSFQTKNLLIGLYSFYMIYTIILSVYEPTAVSFMSYNKAVSQGVLVGVRQTIVGLGMTAGFIIGGFLYGIDRLYVFYFAVLFYIIVLAGFTLLIWLQRREVREYRSKYLEEVKNND